MANPSQDNQSPFRIEPVQREDIDLDEFAKALVLIAKDVAASPAYRRSKNRKTKQVAAGRSTPTKEPTQKGEKP